MGAHAVDSVQGLGEIIAFQQETARGDAFDRLGAAHVRLRLPFFNELTWQQTSLEVMTGFGALAVAVTGGWRAAHGAVDAGLAKITPSMDMAARTLGKGPGQTLRLVHMPMMRGSLLTAVILVFVDTMKELPATLVLRPFNFETLATHVYQFASDEMLEDCALAALAIVLTGILPVILLSRTITGDGADRRVL